MITALHEINLWLTDEGDSLLGNLPDEEKEAQRDNIIRIASDIVQSDDPLIRMREYLCNYVAMASRYDVLRRHPLDSDGRPHHPAEDSRISWTLSQHVGDIALENREVRRLVLSSKVQSVDELLDFIGNESSLAQAYMSAIERMRKPLNDVPSDQNKDWLHPFYISMCAWHEEIFRTDIGLPSLISADNETREAAVYVFAAFMNRLLKGDQDLDQFLDQATSSRQDEEDTSTEYTRLSGPDGG